MDYLEDQANAEAYDYDTAGKGGNRFATILVSVHQKKRLNSIRIC